MTVSFLRHGQAIEGNDGALFVALPSLATYTRLLCTAMLTGLIPPEETGLPGT